MNIFIDGKKVTREVMQCVAFEHKEFIISVAQGPHLAFTETIILLPHGKVLEKEFSVPLLQKCFSNLSGAITAIDKITDAINLGSIELVEVE